jgi:hypothetical protein
VTENVGLKSDTYDGLFRFINAYRELPVLWDVSLRITQRKQKHVTLIIQDSVELHLCLSALKLPVVDYETVLTALPSGILKRSAG